MLMKRRYPTDAIVGIWADEEEIHLQFSGERDTICSGFSGPSCVWRPENHGRLARFGRSIDQRPRSLTYGRPGYLRCLSGTLGSRSAS
jgi:hypothetical protein